MLLVSAGFDAWMRDPLGGMRVTEAGYRTWGRLLRQCSRELCDGRMVSLLEGGYDISSLGVVAEAFVAGGDPVHQREVLVMHGLPVVSVHSGVVEPVAFLPPQVGVDVPPVLTDVDGEGPVGEVGQPCWRVDAGAEHGAHVGHDPRVGAS